MDRNLMRENAGNKNSGTSGLRGFYRIFRWFILAALVMIIALALKPPADLPERADPVQAPGEARAFEGKLEQLEEANHRGDAGVKVEFSGAEVNAFLAQSMANGAAQAKPEPNATPPTGAVPPSTRESDETKEVREAVKDFRVRLQDDEIVGFFVVTFHGRDLDVTVSGKPGAANGYMTFSPTGFKVGSLTIPVSLVDPALQRRLNEPETREKMKLPEFVSDLRVENGQIVIIGK
jgi:hypothetical protein